MNTRQYLKRIGLNETDFAVDLKGLKLLQKQHLLNVPFENLDIHWQRPINLDVKNFYEKIVEQKRGGFCYELNGLFFELLAALGFQCRRISARVHSGNGCFGAEYDHLAILTKIGETEYLVDVGFGNFSAEPLKFVSDIEQNDPNGIFSVRKFDDEYFEIVKRDGENPQSEYIFKDLTRDLAEFSEMCNYHQTSPDSHFTRGKICSLMLENGRKTLTDKRFIETRKGFVTESEIASETEFNELLVREFGIKKPV